jgi:hypothetical protein
MSQLIHVNHSLGNDWGWFIDFMDENEVKDELLKPQIIYSRISFNPPKKTIEIINTSKNTKNTNYFNYVIGLFTLNVLYNFVSKIQYPIITMFEKIKKIKNM